MVQNIKELQKIFKAKYNKCDDLNKKILLLNTVSNLIQAARLYTTCNILLSLEWDCIGYDYENQLDDEVLEMIVDLPLIDDEDLENYEILIKAQLAKLREDPKYKAAAEHDCSKCTNSDKCTNKKDDDTIEDIFK